jgi:hypothetical protein
MPGRRQRRRARLDYRAENVGCVAARRDPQHGVIRVHADPGQIAASTRWIVLDALDRLC